MIGIAQSANQSKQTCATASSLTFVPTRLAAGKAALGNSFGACQQKSTLTCDLAPKQPAFDVAARRNQAQMNLGETYRSHINQRLNCMGVQGNSDQSRNGHFNMAIIQKKQSIGGGIQHPIVSKNTAKIRLKERRDVSLKMAMVEGSGWRRDFEKVTQSNSSRMKMVTASNKQQKIKAELKTYQGIQRADLTPRCGAAKTALRAEAREVDQAGNEEKEQYEFKVQDVGQGGQDRDCK